VPVPSSFNPIGKLFVGKLIHDAEFSVNLFEVTSIPLQRVYFLVFLDIMNFWDFSMCPHDEETLTTTSPSISSGMFRISNLSG
jgi:hypothetical protein